MSRAFKYVAHTGNLVYVGITSDTLSFPQTLLHRREITLMGSRNALPTDFGRIINLIEESKINTVPRITHRIGFDEAIPKFEQFTTPETGAIKALIEVS